MRIPGSKSLPSTPRTSPSRTPRHEIHEHERPAPARADPAILERAQQPPDPVVPRPCESLDALTAIAGHDVARKLHALGQLLQLDADTVIALATRETLRKCLAGLDHECLRAKGQRFRHDPPLALVAAFLEIGRGDLAGRVIRCCSSAAAPQFACDLLERPSDLAGIPAEDIQHCIERARKQLDRIRQTPASIRLAQKLKRRVNLWTDWLRRQLPAQCTFTMNPGELVAYSGAPQDFPLQALLVYADSLHAEPGSAPVVFELVQTFFKIADSLAPHFAVSDQNRTTAASLLRKLLDIVGFQDPMLAMSMADFARQHRLGPLTDATPQALWTSLMDSRHDDLAALARQAVETGTLDAALKVILDQSDPARALWKRTLRAEMEQALRLSASPARTQTLIDNWLKVTCPADIHEVLDKWRRDEPRKRVLLRGNDARIARSWMGNLSLSLAQTGLDAETFIALQLQRQGEMHDDELGALYIGAVANGVHESPFLHFPANIASHAVGVLREALGGLNSESIVKDLLSHLADSHLLPVHVDDFRTSHPRLIALAFTLLKQLPLADAVRAIRTFCLETRSQAFALVLLGKLAHGREFAVLELMSGERLAGLAEGLGAALPVTLDAAKALVAQAAGAAPAARDVVARFLAAEIGRLVQGPGYETRPQKEKRVARFAALLAIASPLLDPATRKALKSAMYDWRGRPRN